MSAIPVFEIGVWNTWLFVAYFWLHPLLMMALDPRYMGKKMASSFEDLAFTKRERDLFRVAMTVLVAASVYSIGLPLRLGTVWWYVGGSIAAAGFVLFTFAMVSIARTPLDQPFTTGMYRYSRHPMNLWSSVGFIGVGIAAASWVFLLLVMAYLACMDGPNDAEERYCLARYGDAYRAYSRRTPKYLGLPQKAA